MTFFFFFTGLDLLVILALILIPMYGLSLELIEVLAWIAERADTVLAVIVGLFVIASILVYVKTRDIRIALPIATVVPLTVVNPVMTFVGIIAAGFTGGFFTKILSIFIAIFIACIVGAISMALAVISFSGFSGLFGIDTANERSLPVYIIEHILILGIHIGYALYTMT